MKILYKILLFTILIAFASCKKYENGPAFSLMSKKARIANIWKVDTFILNGKDKTTEYRQLVTREKLVIFQSGEFEYSEVSNWLWATPLYTGKWSFINDKEELEMIPYIPNKLRFWNIFLMENKNCLSTTC